MRNRNLTTDRSPPLNESRLLPLIDLSTNRVRLWFRYANNAKKASRIYNDRPLSPSESVVYWTEYVIRHEGAPHMKSNAWNLTWYQYYLLDVIATAFIVVAGVVFAVYKIFKLTHAFASNYYCSRIVKSKPE